MNMNQQQQQRDKLVRDLDTNIYKIMDSYKTLLKKGQINTTGCDDVHDEVQVNAASATIVFHAKSILDQIDEIRMQLLLQNDSMDDGMKDV